MKPSEVFGVVIRTIGLLLLMFAVAQFLMALLNLMGGGPGNAAAMILGGTPSLLVGLWFLRGAPIIVSYAYRLDRRKQHGQTRLEEDTLEAMALLKAGKIEEAKSVVDRILNS